MWYLVTIVLIIAAIFLLIHGKADHESVEKIRYFEYYLCASYAKRSRRGIYKKSGQ